MLKTFTRTFVDTVLKLVDMETKLKRKNVDFVRTFKMKHCILLTFIFGSIANFGIRTRDPQFW